MSTIKVQDIVNGVTISILDIEETTNIYITDTETEQNTVTVIDTSYDVARVTAAVGEANTIKEDTQGLYEDTVIAKDAAVDAKKDAVIAQGAAETAEDGAEAAQLAAEAARDLATTTVNNSLTGITSHTEDKKVELDTYTTTKEGVLDAYTTTKEGELDTYTITKEGELDTHTTTKKGELDSYVLLTSKPDLDTYVLNNLKPDLDTYRTATVQPAIAAYVDATTKPSIDAYASTQAATVVQPLVDKAEQWAEETEDIEVETGKYSAKHYAAKAEDTATALGGVLEHTSYEDGTGVKEEGIHIDTELHIRNDKFIEPTENITLRSILSIDGSFEGGSRFGHSYGCTFFDLSTEEAYHGAYSLKMIRGTGTMFAYFYYLANIGDIIYFSLLAKKTTGTLSNVETDVGVTYPIDKDIPLNEWTFGSTIGTNTTTSNPLRTFRFIATEGTTLYIDNFTVINLTQTFGAGNEPSKNQVDKWLQENDYYIPRGDGVIFTDIRLNNNKVLSVINGENNYNLINQLNPVVQTDFHVSIWDTARITDGSSDSNQIRLPITTGVSSQNFVIDWGDGKSVQRVTDGADAIHTYDAEGEYEIKIYGEINGFTFNGTGDREKLLLIRSFGKQLVLGASPFNGCTYMELEAEDLPNFEGIFSSINFFNNCKILNKIPDATKYLNFGTSLSKLFYGAGSFNSNINNWDVSKITDFSYLFSGCRGFNRPLNNWDMSSATTLAHIFDGCTVFNQPIGNWNISNVTNLSYAFSYSKSFTQDLTGWDTSNVTSLAYIFNNAIFSGDISTWDTTKVTSVTWFAQCGGGGKVEVDISWKPATTTNTWVVDTEYTRLYRILATDGKVYRAISDHTSSAATEPLVGTDWATVWELDGGSWNLSNCTNFQQMWNYSTGLGTTNLDKFLIGLKAQDDAGWTIANNMTIHFYTMKYGADPAAIVAHDWLTTPVASGGKGWTISDGGVV